MKTRAKAITDKFPELTERRARRSAFGKHFYLGGGEYRAVITQHRIHYRDSEGKWRENDPVLVDKGGSIELQKASYKCESIAGKVAFTFQVQDSEDWASVELTSVGDKPLRKVPEPVVRNDSIWWDGVVKGVDIELRFDEDRCQFFRHIRGARAARKFSFKKTRTANFSGGLDWDSVGYDSKETVIPRKRWVELNSTKTDWVEAGGLFEQEITEEWTGRVVDEFDPKTRVRQYDTEVVYPVIIDPSVSVTAGTGTQIGYGIDLFSTAWYIYNMYFGVGFGGAYTVRAGMRWSGINIPQGATINSATVTGTVVSRSGTGWSGQIEFSLADNAATFSGGDRPEQLATGTNGSIGETVAMGALNASDPVTWTCTSPVQAVVNRGGWSSGNAMRAIVNPVGASSPNLVNLSRTTRPVLDVTYNEGGGAPQRTLTGVGT